MMVDLTKRLIKNYLPADENGREINLYKLENVSIYGDTFYPNCLFSDIDGNIFNPSSEKVMSLDGINFIKKRDINKVTNEEKNPLFFFIYNTDNYYHFVYDSLPYLITFLDLKEKIPNIKLLMNYPNFAKTEFYKFVIEFLNLLNIGIDDIFIINKNTLYSEIYISSSYTHGIDSNLPPRKEIYDFYQSIVTNIKNNITTTKNLPKKIYISRRTWMHGDTSNIGTNYTTRRKLINEDELVEILKKNGFEEIFSENLNTIEKILLFNNADIVVGPIGGGLCNVLFSKKDCRLISINSPIFMDINERFKYCFSNIVTNYFNEAEHVEQDIWKKWMRIKSGNIIGEIENVEEEYIDIIYTDNTIAGWNNDINYKKIKLKKENCIPLDKGLNSNWIIDIKKLLYYI
jgi:hypothetical protein